MALGINKIILIGNLGNDPEIKYLENGNAMAKLSVATTERWKNKDGEQIEETQWHRVIVFGKLAEICGEYLTKGSSVYLEGKMKYGSYDKDGVKHYTADVVANEMRMLGGGAGAGRSDSASSERAPRREAPASRQAPQAREEIDQFRDDDIPF